MDIRSTLAELCEAFNAHDLDRIMTFFADDCVLEMPRGREPWGTRHDLPRLCGARHRPPRLRKSPRRPDGAFRCGGLSDTFFKRRRFVRSGAASIHLVPDLPSTALRSVPVVRESG